MVRKKNRVNRSTSGDLATESVAIGGASTTASTTVGASTSTTIGASATVVNRYNSTPSFLNLFDAMTFFKPL